MGGGGGRQEAQVIQCFFFFLFEVSSGARGCASSAVELTLRETPELTVDLLSEVSLKILGEEA